MKIKPNTKLENDTVNIPNKVAEIYGLHSIGGTDKEHPYINLKYFDCDYQCFSELDKESLKSFSEANKKLSQLTWNELKRQAGKRGNKTGFAPTMISRDQLPQRSMLERVSEEISFMELRLSQEARMFGFRSGAAFFLVYLDKNHDIT